MLLDILQGDIIPDKADISVSAIDHLLREYFDLAVSFGIKLIIATVVFIIGKWVIKWLRRFIDRFLEKRRIESTVKSFLDSLANITFQIILFLVIVNILGVSTTSFAAILAAAGLAIGMAMKDNLSNFAGGVMLLVNKPFKLGDRIIAQGMDGSVQAIGILYTILLTGDNRTIYLPNGPLSTGSIINFSNQKERRIDIVFTIGYGADINSIKSTLQSVIKSIVQIKDTPAPFIGITTLNNGTFDITIRVWVNSGDYSSVNVELNEKVYTAFHETGIYAPSSINVKMLKD
ncbi:mechanosensitive ion channel [Dysgonomonas sp. Marseille-P4677]|uniref:mechanosensitive ion channel family protein n=1 Tax=Dysgonomonas sp. Marseille-P4677 TaxID=2364790 RepID=UPI001914D685|nr:mechanosensitive ion channel domain-containing protein [Dysgonomonas sp. Marseille-P4677]MBK5721629.1 mechanosensitive ion channel [Dysgonomonas sp. Marseille-P4677]